MRRISLAILLNAGPFPAAPSLLRALRNIAEHSNSMLARLRLLLPGVGGRLSPQFFRLREARKKPLR
jgi:hypothetical protein